MANIDSYLSEGFLKEFIETFPKDFFSDDFLPNVELYRFLDKHTDIILGGKKEDYEELVKTEDGLTRNLIDRYLQGDDSVKFADWDVEHISNNRKIFKFFFLSSRHSSTNSQLNQLGYATYHLKNDQNPKKIVGYDAIAVTRDNLFSNRLNSWNQLKHKILPSHSIIVVDNYLFTSPEQTNATISMMESILAECNPNTNISFIYNSNTYKINNVSVSYPWNDLKDRISATYLNSYRNLSITKFKYSSNFHDRLIITNCQLIMIGNSFSQIFNLDGTIKLSSPSVLNLNSHACRYNSNDWSEIGRLMLQTLKNLINDPRYSSRVLGDSRTNPLLN